MQVYSSKYLNFKQGQNEELYFRDNSDKSNPQMSRCLQKPFQAPQNLYINPNWKLSKARGKTSTEFGFPL